MKTRLAAVLLASAVAACAAPPSTPGSPTPPAVRPTAGVSLPPDAAAGAADPGRQAILNTASAFAAPTRLAQRPADAALAIAQAEFLAVDLGTNQRWQDFSPLVAVGFRNARPEWRSAAGIAPNAGPQAVIDALFAARRALQQGNTAAAAAALPAPTFVNGGSAALARLSSLPALPRTAEAARSAGNELMGVSGRRR